MRSVLVRFGHFLFLFRDYLFPITFLFVLLLTRPTLPFGSEWGDWIMDGFGIALALLGQGYRMLAAGCAVNIRRRGRGKQIGAARVIQDGMFAHSRNPLYFGNMLIILGFVVIANNLWSYVVVLPVFFLVYFAIIFAEEEVLLRQFGSGYAKYCHDVNRFLPRLRGLMRSLTQSAFDWRRAVRREYGNICSWGAMICILLIWERWEHFGYAARKEEIHQLLGVLLAVPLLYVSLRWCKNQGLFRSETSP